MVMYDVIIECNIYIASDLLCTVEGIGQLLKHKVARKGMWKFCWRYGPCYMAAVLHITGVCKFNFRHVCVSLKVMEKLLSEVSAQRLQLLAESYLDMIHELLQSNTHFFQNMAANSVRIIYF